MKSKKIKILQIGIGDEVFGGVEKILTNIFFEINHNKFVFDFLSPYKSSYEQVRDEIEKYEGKLITLGIKRDSIKNKLLYGIKLYKFLKNNHYDIIHVNTGVLPFMLEACLAARLSGCKRIIAHSHNNIKPDLIRKIIRQLIYRFSDKYLACSYEAAISMFPKKIIQDVVILKNGMHVNEYRFDYDLRKKMRKELGVKDSDLLLGCVGRFEKQKNHLFLIDIFNEIKKINKNTKLLLIGNGILENEILKKINKYNLEDSVIMTGFQNQINSYLSSMDYFVLPSLYEGLGIVLLEAQTNGLVSITSTNVASESKISNYIYYLDLNIGAKNWAKKILNINTNNIKSRKNLYKNAINSGYDLSSTIKNIEKIYINMMEK